MNTSQTKRSSHGKKKYQVKKKPSTAETKSPARQPHHSPGELDFDADLYQQLLLAAKDPSYPNLKPLLAQCPPAYLNMSLRCPKQQTKTKNPKFSPSPLGLACEHGHIAFVQIAVETLKLVLLNSTTSTNLLSSIHAFSIASQFCHLDLVQYMLDHPNEVPLPTKNVTELHRILMQLLGRNSAAKTKIKMTIVPILERVLSHWTDDHISLAVNQVETKIGLSPFHLAVQTQEPTLLMLFMHRGGGNPQVRDQKGDSAFQLVQKSYLALDAKHHTTNGRGKKRRNRARAKTSVSGSSNTNHPDGGGGDPVACYMILLRHEEKEERSRIWCGFSRYRPEFITSEHMRGEILSSVGLSALFQPFALTKDAKDDDQDFKSVLAHVAMFHRSATKPGGGVLVEYWEKMKQLSTVQMHVAPRVIHRMLESCLEESCTPRYIRSLASIFMQWYVPTTKKQQESREEPKEQYFPSLDDRFYVRLCETLSGVGKKLLFGIFDRHDLDVNYDEDVEHDRYNALFELFLQLYVPSLFIMSNDQAERVTRYQMCTSSMEYLWEHVPHALGVLNGSIDNPSRFAVILQSKIISCQVEASFGCSSLVDMILQQQPTPKTSGNRRKHQKKTQNLLKRLSAELPIPSSFISWIRPLADKVDQLLLADIRLCRSFLHMCLRLPVGFISPRRKVEYLAALAEDRTSSNQQDDELCLQINRMSMTREEVLDFVLCQVSTLGPKMMQQELEIHYMYEPGVGLGPVREFFQFLRERVFQPTKSKNRECFDPKEENTKHSSMKMMEVVEHNHSNTFSMKDYYYHYHPKDVELKKKVQRLSLGAGDQVAGHAFAPYFQFTSESKEYLQIRSSRYRVYQMCRSVPGEAKPAMILSTIYSRQPDLLQCYRCIGRFIGLSIRHEQSLGIFFSIAFWKIMLRQEPTWREYCQDDQEFISSCETLLNTRDLSELGEELFFEYTTQVCVGETTKTLSLAFDTDENIRHSPVSQTRVTNENKSQWVLAKSRQIFYQCETQAYAHLRLGLEDVLPNLQMFAPEELQTLVRGPASIDIAELRANTIYRGYAPHDRVIQDFWSLLETSWSIEQLEQLLCFWSGSPRPPMFGFVPSLASDESDTPWSIDRWSASVTKCPQSNTCDHRLLLPEYTSRDQLHTKLLQAIEFGALGFDRM